MLGITMFAIGLPRVHYILAVERNCATVEACTNVLVAH